MRRSRARLVHDRWASAEIVSSGRDLVITLCHLESKRSDRGMDQEQDAGPEPRRGRSGKRRGSLATGVIFCIAAVVFLLEFLVLPGVCVFDHRLKSSREVYLEIPINQVGQRHTLEIYTRRKAKLDVTLAAPDGEVLVAIDELSHHKSHYADFTPKVAGKYVLEGGLRWSGRSSSPRVQVLVNDRRFFGPWAYSFGF